MSLRALMVLVVSVSTLAAACGSAEPEWQVFTSDTGAYQMDLPGEPEVQTQAVPGSDLEVVVALAEIGGDAFGTSEVVLPPDTPFQLDGAVDGALQGALSDLEQQSEASGSITDQVVETGEFAGVETREYSATLTAGDISVVSSGIVFVLDDVLVQLTAIDRDGDDQDITDRMLGSLTAL